MVKKTLQEEMDKIPQWIRSKGSISAQIAAGEFYALTKLDWMQIVPEAYHEFGSVFEKDSFDALPERHVWDHAIDFIPGSLPGVEEQAHKVPFTARKNFNGKVYPLTLEEQGKLDEFLDENLKSGRIRPSKSPICASFFFVKKKTSDLRPVQDYRRLNTITIRNRYPLPLTQELFDLIWRAKWFTKLDVQ